jgi:hypothetical protein
MKAPGFSPDDFFALLCQIFPDDRPATFNDIASLIQRVKEVLDSAQMPAARQRRYVEDVLDLEAVLLDRAVFAEPPHPGTAPATEEAEAREIVQHWLAVFWPAEGAKP